ncbi:MAG TPA: bifunctional 2-polyprenyl-6-hydroxyphenol methylase/3-demethylubiquinol 3-O-methyltransferase UbiG [Rhodocyclaceae bacterium]
MTTDTKPFNANADLRELEKFAELAHRWWDPNSEFKPLHDINPLRAEFIRESVEQAGTKLDQSTLLDVGCGGGLLSEAMAAMGAQVTGIDLGEKALGVARLHALESGSPAKYRLVAAEALADEAPGSFDVVTCLEMLEHVPDPAQTVAACARLVRPGGHLFFSTLNRNPKSYLFAIIGAEYLLRMLPKGTHDYQKFIRPAELTRWCRDSGLDVAELIGMSYNPLTQTYRLGRDLSVNYLLRARRPA